MSVIAHALNEEMYQNLLNDKDFANLLNDEQKTAYR